MIWILITILKTGQPGFPVTTISSMEFNNKSACLSASMELNRVTHDFQISDDKAVFLCIEKGKKK